MELVRFTVTTQTGETHDIEGATGHTLMEAIRDSGFGDMQALCGGCCSCATCHVYVDDLHLGQIAPMSEPENDLLDGADHRTAHSRLSCQIDITAALAGMSVALAPQA